MRKLFLILIIVAVGLLAFVFLSLRPVKGSDRKQVVVRVERGQGVNVIAATLKEKKLIRSSFVFKSYVRLHGLQSKLQAGQFALSPSQSMAQIAQVLQNAKDQQISITIPEGFTIAEIDALLAGKGLGESGDIVACAFICPFSQFEFLPKRSAGRQIDGFGSRIEGYVFPETYFVSLTDYAPETFLARTIDAFKKRIVAAHEKELAGSKHTLTEIVTMASLVEEESRHESERAIIADILWRRLQSKIGLGVDATVRYALAKKNAALTEEDLRLDSAYNTRRYRGLPPSAIANPGESSIVAALKPFANEYWYYLHDSKGEIHYAKTNDGHNENKAKYLR